MNYISVCSGIEAATVAWHPLGWNPLAFSEIEAFPSAVLNHHYPDVPNVGDMTKFKEWNFGSKTVDLLVGGTPCQSFSVAGLRKGLEDPRGNLALVYCGILDHFRPQWFVWENVPGVLSSNGGRDFGSFLGALAELGYGFAYRVLDAQYFGVAQRRRRVFVVGYLGDWRPAAEVLFESESLLRDSPPSRKAGQEVAGTIAARFGISRNNHEECVVASGKPTIGTLMANAGTKLWSGNQEALTGDYHILQPIALAENTIGRQPHNGGNGDGFTDGGPMYTLNATGVHGVAQPIGFNARQDPDTWQGRTGPLDTDGGTQAVAIGTDCYNGNITGVVAATLSTRSGTGVESGPTVMVANPVAPTLTASNDPSRSPQSTEVTNQVAAVYLASMAVRRLTPVECERLQGFPDDYTNIPWRKADEAPDGPRYKALGNSMAVPVMAWIGKRISQFKENT